MRVLSHSARHELSSRSFGSSFNCRISVLAPQAYIACVVHRANINRAHPTIAVSIALHPPSLSPSMITVIPQPLLFKCSPCLSRLSRLYSHVVTMQTITSHYRWIACPMCNRYSESYAILWQGGLPIRVFYFHYWDFCCQDVGAGSPRLDIPGDISPFRLEYWKEQGCLFG